MRSRSLAISEVTRLAENPTAAVIPSEVWPAIESLLGLSDRELDVVRGVVSGGTEAAIAHRLGISSHTVHSHLDRIYRKLGVTNRVALVVRVFSAYLTDRTPA